MPRVGFSEELEDMSRPPAVSDSACATCSRPAAPTPLEALPPKLAQTVTPTPEDRLTSFRSTRT